MLILLFIYLVRRWINAFGSVCLYG